MVLSLGTKLGQSRTVNSLWKMLYGVVSIHITYQNRNERPEERGRGNKEKKNQQNNHHLNTWIANLYMGMNT